MDREELVKAAMLETHLSKPIVEKVIDSVLHSLRKAKTAGSASQVEGAPAPNASEIPSSPQM